jgi:hypothetical protein
MPAYINSPFAPLPEVAIPAKPAYFWGSLPVDTQDTAMRISSVSLTSNVASVTGTIFRGSIPVAGNLISIQGTTSNSGVFNVSSVAIASVTGTPSTGVYTLTFALTHANITATADSGMAVIPIAEVAEALTNSTSVAIYVPSNELRDLGERSITVATTFPSAPSAATVTLYSSINNDPTGTEWTEMGVVATVAGSVPGPLVTLTVPAGRFFRLVNSGVSGGTSPTIISKMVP